MKPVRVPYRNVEDDKEEDYSSSDGGSKLDKEDNDFGDCQNSNDNSEEDEDVNAGNDTFFF